MGQPGAHKPLVHPGDVRPATLRIEDQPGEACVPGHRRPGDKAGQAADDRRHKRHQHGPTPLSAIHSRSCPPARGSVARL